MSKIHRTFDDFFATATDLSGPYPYQRELATDTSLPELLSVPTGVGKTAAAILGWLWRRRFHVDAGIRDATPRRLVYCLPMRTLVEQTHDFARNSLNRLGMLTENTGDSPVNGWAKQQGDTGRRIAVSILMGGSEKDELRDWSLWPERDAILIGTQDMLLSRVLNRGYAAGRARWPLDFALLNNDCLWVFDEVQLMSTGLATSLQLDAWRKSLPLQGEDGFRKAAEGTVARSCHSLWMSATLAKHWLETAVDWKSQVTAAWQRKEEEDKSFREQDRGPGGPLAPLFASGNKRLGNGKRAVAEINVKRGTQNDERADITGYLDKLAVEVKQRCSPDGVTLIIVNTVDRAVGLYERLTKSLDSLPIHLIHSRFRPVEREGWRDILDKGAGPRVIVSTQVIEAGVDISAKVLFTELAPWPSLVQRFGRCARYVDLKTKKAEHGDIFWMNTLNLPLPYDKAELESALDALKQLDDAGLAGLEQLLSNLDNNEQRRLFPYEPRFVPRDKDLFDLFDTTPDLTGADVDISRFIRDGDELDVQVFWRDITEKKPAKKLRARRKELCSVPFLRMREFMKKLPFNRVVWRWTYARGDWERVTPDHSEVIFPGQVFLLETSCGGYDRKLGWTGDPNDTDFHPVLVEKRKEDDEAPSDEDDDSDEMSVVESWLNIEQHTRDVCCKLKDLLANVTGLVSEVSSSELKVLRLAAFWHDRGKAHAAFQAKLDPDVLLNLPGDVLAKLGGESVAKAPNGAWRRGSSKPSTIAATNDVVEQDLETTQQTDARRPKFRHELASALAILETLWLAKPDHEAFQWPEELSRADFSNAPSEPVPFTDQELSTSATLLTELQKLTSDEVDLLVYLVAAHHGKVRMSLRSVPEDLRTDLPDACPPDRRQARGVRDNDPLPKCRLWGTDNANTGWTAPEVSLHLDPMELGLSGRYGASWRERTQRLLEHLGPFRLAYLESLLRIADCRASAEEDAAAKRANAKEPNQ